MARNIFAAGFLVLTIFGRVSPAGACPFCSAVQPSFAERREAADVLLLGEATGESAGNTRTFSVRQVLKGRDVWGEPTTVDCSDADKLAGGSLALLLGRRQKSDDLHTAAVWSWEVVPVDEASASYFVRAPAANKPAAERLRYFVKFLEHADAQTADDAFREFGLAPYDAVVAVADAFDYGKVRTWIVDRGVPDARKGFYGLVLGLARDESTRRENIALLRQIALADSTDFRAGYDGVLAGWLVAEGTAALDQIDARILKNSRAAEGDVRHAQAALRFYLQDGRDIPEARLLESTILLLDRPATAPVALTDLMRRQHWTLVERAEKLFRESPGNDPLLDQAVVGYLLVCPRPAAGAALGRLRATYAARLEEAERHWSALGVRGSS